MFYFNDNFFDLLPNTSKRITLSKSFDKVEAMSLADTLNE
ncbi:glycoside hydrolase family 2 protein [Chryseobacterium sp.]